MGARGCRMVLSAADLSPALIDAIGYSRTGTAIVEEYMDGPEFSLEALVYDGEIHMTGFADRHIFFPPYFIEMGHTIPTSFSAEDQEALCEVFHKGIRSLGLSWGVAKGDIKLTKKRTDDRRNRGQALRRLYVGMDLSLFFRNQPYRRRIGFSRRRKTPKS